MNVCSFLFSPVMIMMMMTTNGGDASRCNVDANQRMAREVSVVRWQMKNRLKNWSNDNEHDEHDNTKFVCRLCVGCRIHLSCKQSLTFVQHVFYSLPRTRLMCSLDLSSARAVYSVHTTQRLVQPSTCDTKCEKDS